VDRGGTEEASQFLMCKLDMISFKIPFLLTDGNIPSHIIVSTMIRYEAFGFVKRPFL
jgi:hypothetical protein